MRESTCVAGIESEASEQAFMSYREAVLDYGFLSTKQGSVAELNLIFWVVSGKIHFCKYFIR